MKNSGIKCEIGITYDNVERLNTYLEKSVNGADQLHIVAGVHDKQATTFSGKVYNKDNAPMVTNVHYPIEFDTDKVALIDLRVNKMYTDEFGHNFIKCRSLTEESLRKIVFAMQREVFGIIETDNNTKKVKECAARKYRDTGYKPLPSGEDTIPLNDDMLVGCRSLKEQELFEKLQPVRIMKNGDGRCIKYKIDDDSMQLIVSALEDKVTISKRVAKRLNVCKATFDNKLYDWRRAQNTCK